MKQSTVTKVVMLYKNDKGEPVKSITSEEAFNRKVAAAQKASEEAPTAQAIQAVTLNLAETLEEALALSGGDEALAVTHFNYGSSLRQHNEANDLIQEDGFAAQETPIDLAYAVAEKSEGRRKQTNEEKAAKALGVTPEQLMAALALVKQQASATA